MYNRTTHSTTGYSPFEVIYGFNPLTPLDLVPLPRNEQISLDGAAKVKLVRDLHEKVRLQIIKKNEHYARQANQGRKRISFVPGDWVWVHMRKERFPTQRKTKLHPRGDGPFQVIARISDNAYTLDLPGDIGVSATFNVSDLTPFDFDEDLMDSRASPFQKGGTDDSSDPSSPKIASSTYQDEIPTTSSRVDQPSCISKNGPNHLIGIGGPMTRARTRKMNEALTQLLIDIHKEN